MAGDRSAMPVVRGEVDRQVQCASMFDYAMVEEGRGSACNGGDWRAVEVQRG